MGFGVDGHPSSFQLWSGESSKINEPETVSIQTSRGKLLQASSGYSRYCALKRYVCPKRNTRASHLSLHKLTTGFVDPLARLVAKPNQANKLFVPASGHHKTLWTSGGAPCKGHRIAYQNRLRYRGDCAPQVQHGATNPNVWTTASGVCLLLKWRQDRLWWIDLGVQCLPQVISNLERPPNWFTLEVV